MRSFTIESIKKQGSSKSSKTGGRYISSTPASAAQKAFTKRFHNNTSKTLKATVVIRETTQNSLKKTYKYTIKRVYDPVEVEKGKETIEYKFRYKIKSVN